MMQNEKYFTPQEIVAELDKYIVGQKEAKKHVAIALRNRWRRMHVKSDMQKEIMPNNILMIGSTGVGKTEIARRLAKLADAPFVKVEASKFTEVGYVGRDVEGMIRDLAEQAVSMVKEQKKKEINQKVESIVEDIILDILIPPLKGHQAGESDIELNERTRERMREKLKNGELDDRKIEINVENNQPNVGVFGGTIDEMSLMNIQEAISSLMPKRTKRRKVTIAEAKKILMEEESAKLIDMDEVKQLAIQKCENSGIVFIDEIDKIASRGGYVGGPDVSREGVQRDLLPIVEGSVVNTKYGAIRTDHILFIAAGAFHVSKPSDLIPELQGRFPIRVELESLTKDDFYQILKTPKNALTKQYQALFEAEGVELNFTDEALAEIAEIAYQINMQIENIGARRLHTVMSQLLNDFLFDVPEVIGANAKVLITQDMVKEKLAPLMKNRDLSQYIL
ncbi:MAG: ATP-dependent protease ATPase subunit HslU [Flammeovirgaceae bacterium]|nr:ATP-dependent protease ATPase subunit HslU [Flammeovirgaceae bacterium]MDW8286677.1 ATP-dependent protease ATPase subunit HslU [Flammeovirgaceae bacterium]